jgi:hypothetical protein
MHHATRQDRHDPTHISRQCHRERPARVNHAQLPRLQHRLAAALPQPGDAAELQAQQIDIAPVPGDVPRRAVDLVRRRMK